MIFSYVENPRHKNMNIQFITGKEKALNRRDYKVGDYIKDYWETEVLLGEFKTKKGEWLFYWVPIRDGQIVGVELMKDDMNKFDVAVKYGLTKVYKTTSKL
mgnify:CR=1 FL=1